MTRLDRTELRIVGVLIEKQLSVPDSYPLSENALLDGCNQKNNRDPITELVAFQVSGALMSLQDKGYAARVEGGGRVARFKHRVAEQLHLDPKELAVLAELLVRGAQAPGALKTRVGRMGCHASPEEIEAMLRGFSQKMPPLVEQLTLAPRERDQRWRHLMGDGSELQQVSLTPAAPADSPAPVGAPRDSGLEGRVAAVEDSVTRLRQQITDLEQRLERLSAPH